MSSDPKEVKAVIANLGPLLQRYRGGMPLGFLAAIIQAESGGRMVAGDANLGEFGYLQVAADVPPKFGYPAALRTTPEGNVFLGCLEYAINAITFAVTDPRIVLGTEDSWKFARLGFAIGMGGTRKLLAASQGMGATPWQAVRTYVQTTPGMTLGSQSPAKVRARVELVDTLWQVGQAVAPGGPGLPTIPSPPSGLQPPTVQPSILAKLAKARSSQMLLVLAAVAAGVWFYFRR